MATSSHALTQLHHLLQKLREVQDDLARGPKQVQLRTTGLQKRQGELQAARDRLKQTKMTADQKSLQLKTNEAKLADLRNKLNIAASNREYEIISGQIAADTMANSVLEDEILEALTKVDQVQVEVRQAEQAVLQAEKDLQNATADAQAREPGLKEREKSLQAEVAAAEKFLPPDIIGQYRRTTQAYGAEALAAVENKVCTSCYMQISAQKLVELKSGKLMFCTCGRLMYVPTEG